MASFAEKLTAVLEERGMSNRALAKILESDNVESARRTIRKWKSGDQVPKESSRDAVTDALGLERGALDPDDEEDSLILALVNAVGAAKLKRILDEVAA